MIRMLCNMLVVIICASLLVACGAENPVGPTPTPTPVGPSSVTITAITLAGKNIDFHTTALEVGQSEPVKVTAMLSDGTTKDVTNDADVTSSDTSVATISDKSINGMARGTSVIRAKVGDLMARMDITVKDVTPPNYDGRWTGSGTGTTNVSTPATVEISFQRSSGVITTMSLHFRVETAPGTPQTSYCGTFPDKPLLFSNLTINDQSFSGTMTIGQLYNLTVRGTFSGASVTGVAVFENQNRGVPWCPSAIVNWTGRHVPTAPVL